MQNLKIKLDAELKLINEMQKLFEQWKVIDDYDNYSISSFGRVRNDKTKRILKATIDRNGYSTTYLYLENKKHFMQIHRLYAKAFIENLNNKSFVDHINNDKSNNHYHNLRWATRSEHNMNRSKSSNNTSGVTGVLWNKRNEKWCAQITKINAKFI